MYFFPTYPYRCIIKKKCIISQKVCFCCKNSQKIKTRDSAYHQQQGNRSAKPNPTTSPLKECQICQENIYHRQLINYYYHTNMHELIISISQYKN